MRETHESLVKLYAQPHFLLHSFITWIVNNYRIPPKSILLPYLLLLYLLELLIELPFVLLLLVALLAHLHQLSRVL